MKPVPALVCLAALSLAGGCATTGGENAAAQRESILAMKSEVLDELYRRQPDVRQQIASAPGHAVFSNANVNLVLASFGGGYGVATDNRSGRHTYMKMGEVGVGLGLGVKDFRLVFVFHDEAAMRFRLYNLKKDPRENRDLAKVERDKMKEMRALYDEFKAKIPAIKPYGGGKIVGGAVANGPMGPPGYEP